MLLELAKPVALLLCLLSLFAVFHTLFLSIEDPHLILVPHKAFDDRILDSLLLLALSAAISLMGGIIFREAEPYPPPPLATTLPALDLLLGHRHHDRPLLRGLVPRNPLHLQPQGSLVAIVTSHQASYRSPPAPTAP